MIAFLMMVINAMMVSSIESIGGDKDESNEGNAALMMIMAIVNHLQKLSLHQKLPQSGSHIKKSERKVILLLFPRSKM